MTRDNQGGFLSRVLTTAHSAGSLWRDKIKPGLEKINERAREAGEAATNAKAYFQTNFTEDGRQLKDQWSAMLHKGASQAISGLRGIAAVSWESLSGLHPKLGLALLELHRLETLAAAREALTVQEMLAAKEHFEDLRTKLEATPNAIFDKEFERMGALLVSARQAIARVPVNQSAARQLYITVSGTVSENLRLAAEYANRGAEYTTKFGAGAITNPIDPALAPAQKAAVDAINAQLRSADPMTAAIPLANIAPSAEALREDYIAALEKIATDLQDLQSLDGLMMSMDSDADARGFKNDPQLLAAARAFVKATRNHPVDLVAAREQKDAYLTRFEDLAF